MKSALEKLGVHPRTNSPALAAAAGAMALATWGSPETNKAALIGLSAGTSAYLLGASALAGALTGGAFFAVVGGLSWLASSAANRARRGGP